MAEETVSKERKRLIELWKAYETQEREYSEALKKILTNEKSLREAGKMKRSLRQLIEEKNREIMELELKNTTLKTDLDEIRPQMEEKERLVVENKKRYAKLYALTEELEEELERARKEIEARDRWFKENISNLENLNKSLDGRKLLIEQAKKGEELSSSKAMMELERPGIKEEIASVVEENIPDEVDEPSFDEEPTFDDEPSFEENTSFDDDEDMVEEQMKPEKSRIDVIKEFSKLDSLNPTLANALYNSGYTTLEQLRDTSESDLRTVKGFDELRVESLQLDLME